MRQQNVVLIFKVKDQGHSVTGSELNEMLFHEKKHYFSLFFKINYSNNIFYTQVTQMPSHTP